MTMTDWANNEIKLFKEYASEEDKGHIEAVASAYSELMEDDHSGMSIDVTYGLINGLINAKEENPDKWAEERKAKEKSSKKEADDEVFIEVFIEYACACVDSAAKAYKAMLKVEKPVSDRAKELLNRLIKGQPLSPITEDDFKAALHRPLEEWEVNMLRRNHLKSSTQCPRMFSLFREEDLDGNVAYSDNNRVVYMDQRGTQWYSARAMEVVSKMFPITMPYYPTSKPYLVHGREYYMEGDVDKSEEHRGTVNVTYYDYLITPEGKRVELNIKIDEREERDEGLE